MGGLARTHFDAEGWMTGGAKSGKGRDLFLLFLAEKAIGFSPDRDAYYILFGERFDALEAVRAGNSDPAAGMIAYLNDAEPALADVTRLRWRVAPDIAVRQPTSTTFEERFRDYLSGLNPREDTKIRWRYVATAIFEAARANILLALNKSARLYRAGAASAKQPDADSGAVTLTTQQLSEMAHSIDWVRRYTPLRFDCIIVASIYTRLLASEGSSTEIVIGVCADPFTAHMWAESGSLVLGEKTNVVEAFEPIYRASWTQ